MGTVSRTIPKLESESAQKEKIDLLGPYKCPYCNERFSLLEHQKKHLRTYHLAKRFRCLVYGCEKGFTRKSRLIQHMELDHPESITCEQIFPEPSDFLQSTIHGNGIQTPYSSTPWTGCFQEFPDFEGSHISESGTAVSDDVSKSHANVLQGSSYGEVSANTQIIEEYSHYLDQIGTTERNSDKHTGFGNERMRERIKQGAAVSAPPQVKPGIVQTALTIIHGALIIFDRSLRLQGDTSANYYNLSDSFATLVNEIRGIFRPRVPSNYRRVQWKCGCGTHMYDDFKLGSTDEQVSQLAGILQSPLAACHLQSTSVASGASGAHIRGTSSTSSSISSSPASSSSFTPSGTTSTASSLSDYQISNAQTQAYLELCINTGEYTKTLSEIDLRDINCDGMLFTKIRSEYNRIRGLRSRFWLLKPSGVHFVRFALEDPLSVSILQKPLSVPPQYEVTAKNYSYTPCPLQDDPPMSEHTFLHYLSCTAYNPKLAWLPRLPKKLEPSLLRFKGAVNYGWGIHIYEGPNYFAVGMLNLLMMVLSGLAAFLWKYLRGDFQGAFGFAGWIVAVANGILVAYIMKWQQE